MNQLLTIKTREDIPAEYQDTPIAQLLKYHNLGEPHTVYENGQLFIGMCMDNRKKLRTPENFAFVIRAGGANLRYSEFKVSYAIGVRGIKHVALIGHTNCGMVDLASRKDQFVQGLVENAGWDAKEAEDHFYHYSPMFEIGNEVDFILSETKRLRLRYPKIKIAPILYRVEDNLLYLIKEDE